MVRLLVALVAMLAGVWAGVLLMMFIFASLSFGRETDGASFTDARLLMFELTENTQLILAGLTLLATIGLAIFTRRQLAYLLAALALVAALAAVALPLLVTGPMEQIRLDLLTDGQAPSDSPDYMRLHGFSFALYLLTGVIALVLAPLATLVRPRREADRVDAYERELRRGRDARR
jgi:hypothetical protein